jgi:hypothetical protein
MRAFIVTDAAGECLLPSGDECAVFTSVAGANTAARVAGLSDWQVRPQ